ncbi:unnamed protein product [Aspergillus oryzae]|nr:unnamed protein product [Aspergillus oryzae]GMF86193.1 unnamed protein product [Aspergillus oryzae]GMG02489.1 unnamed protein product [Aspergillus oryzae]
MSMTVSDSTQIRDGFPRPFPDTPANVLEQFKLNGKVVVVTGAADGIGLAVAEAMAEAGAHVALWGEELAKDHGVRTVAYKVDGKFSFSVLFYSWLLRRAVSNPEEVQKAVTDVVGDFERIDVFVANAGELGL